MHLWFKRYKRYNSQLFLSDPSMCWLAYSKNTLWNVLLFIYCVQGKFYLLLEELSQLFRALVPIQLWYKYIVGGDPSNSYFLGAMLIIIYSICKVAWPK